MGYNLKDAGGSSFSPLPTNRYTLKVEKAEVATSANGNEVIRLQFSVCDGDHKGRFCFDNLVFTDNSLWKVRTLLEKVGSDLIGKTDVSPAQVATALMGKQLSVYVEKGFNNKGSEINTLKEYQSVSDDSILF